MERYSSEQTDRLIRLLPEPRRTIFLWGKLATTSSMVPEAMMFFTGVLNRTFLMAVTARIF